MNKFTSRILILNVSIQRTLISNCYSKWELVWEGGFTLFHFPRWFFGNPSNDYNQCSLFCHETQKPNERMDVVRNKMQMSFVKVIAILIGGDSMVVHIKIL